MESLSGILTFGTIKMVELLSSISRHYVFSFFSDCFMSITPI